MIHMRRQAFAEVFLPSKSSPAPISDPGLPGDLAQAVDGHAALEDRAVQAVGGQVLAQVLAVTARAGTAASRGRPSR